MFDLSLNKATLQASLIFPHYTASTYTARNLIAPTIVYTHYATPVFENGSRIAMPNVPSARGEIPRGGKISLRRENATVGCCLCCTLAKDEDEISVG